MSNPTKMATEALTDDGDRRAQHSAKVRALRAKLGSGAPLDEADREFAVTSIDKILAMQAIRFLLHPVIVGVPTVQRPPLFGDYKRSLQS